MPFGIPGTGQSTGRQQEGEAQESSERKSASVPNTFADDAFFSIIADTSCSPTPNTSAAQNVGIPETISKESSEAPQSSPFAPAIFEPMLSSLTLDTLLEPPPSSPPGQRLPPSAQENVVLSSQLELLREVQEALSTHPWVRWPNLVIFFTSAHPTHRIDSCGHTGAWSAGARTLPLVPRRCC